MCNDSKLPDLSLPFFAYGIFKQGELAYESIKKYVQDEDKIRYISAPDYYLGLLDGAAVMLPKETAIKVYRKHPNCHIGRSIVGTVLTFEKGKEATAYRIIKVKEGMIKIDDNGKDVEISTSNYTWGKIETEDHEWCNCLLINECRDNRIVHYCQPASEDHKYNWSSENDIMFTMNMIYLYNEVFTEYIVPQKLDPKSMFDWKLAKPLFKIQMAYLSLFSIFNRYYKLKFNANPKKPNAPPVDVSKLMFKTYKEAGENAYSKSKRGIKRSDSNKYDTFGIEDSFAEYFYGIRNNAVHKGKGMPDDFEILRAGFLDLYYYLLVMLYEQETVWKKIYDEQYPGLMETVREAYLQHLPKKDNNPGSHTYHGNRRHFR